MLTITIIFTSVVSPTTAHAVTNRNKESLITNVENPRTGLITFKITVPAKTTVKYKVELILKRRMGSLDTIEGSIKNNKLVKVTKTVSAITRYYSNQYTVTASYSKGPARIRINYSDVDSATSALKETILSSKFTWTDSNIKKWSAGEKLYVTLTLIGGAVLDILISKGYISSMLFTFLSVSSAALEIISAGKVADPLEIQTTPIKGWSYRFKFEPTADGIKKYFLVYDQNGKLNQSFFCGEIPLSEVTLIIN